MKNPAEPNSTSTDLPSFLDTGAGVETVADDTSLAADDTDDAFGDDEPLETTDADDGHAEHAQPDSRRLLGRTRATTRAAGNNAPGNGVVTMTLGCMALLVAALLGTALEGSNAATALAHFGLTSPTLIVLGSVLVTGGMLRRHLATLHSRLANRHDDGDDWSRSAQAQESLEFLVAAQHASNERPPAAGEELQHVLMAMQRQDEKINNLTKAIKMYGKPLMEISGQSTDLAGAIAQAKTAIEANAEAGRQAFSRLEGQLREDATPKQERAEMLDALHVIAADVDKLTRKQVGVSLEPLQQHIGKIEVAIAALSQRLESSEVQKSLLRLEDAAQKTRDEVHQLRGDGLGKATSQLQDRLDKATKGLTDGLQQMRDGNLGGLESGMREIQRELSGVATTVAQIQAVVRSGRAAVAASVPQVAPSAAPNAPPAAASAPTPAPAATAAKPTDGNSDASAGYQTGTRSSSGKNVLGAIAKLKQMKG